MSSLIHHHNHQNLAEMNLPELQEIAMRQQQQIEINQQLLMAKEKRLKLLKLEEQKNQQLALLTAQTSTSSNHNLNIMGSPNDQTNNNNNGKLETLKQNVLGQELKIFKLKQLRNQIIEYKLSNSNMYSELDLIKSLFNEKERELYKAVNKVSELTKQIDQLRKIKTSNNNTQSSKTNNLNNQQIINSFSELDKLKQELQIRNKLNEQQSKKIIQQHELFNKKQLEVLALDKRIEELKNRIAAKRGGISSSKPENQQQHRSQLIASPVNIIQQLESNINNKPSTPVFNENAVQFLSNSDINGKNNVQSPSKLLAKFATKQEIANTYMNKYGMETYQKYQQTSMRLIQQQNVPILNNNSQPTSIPIINMINNNNNNNKNSDDTSETSSSTSSSNQILSNNLQSPVSDPNHQSSLPSHLKYEFDKIKYLPDVVKTIKKRHSISEIESNSANTIPPQIYQKILEKHHLNNNKSENSNTNKLNDIDEQAEINFNNDQTNSFQQKQIENGSNTEEVNKSKSLHVTSKTVTITSLNNTNSNNSNNNNNNNNNQKIFLSTFMPQHQQTQSQPQQKEMIVEEEPKSEHNEITIKTKSIIKQTSNILNNNNNNDLEFAQNEELIVNNNNNNSRRVNFDPHALLLDAAVEGELDLIVRCSRQLKDVSEPNDEGITALHNSVCAGHFDIVKFLVEYGCDINYADNDGWTPLHCAASCNNIQMIKFLIESGAAIYSTTLSDNETAIKKCEEDEDGFQICFEYLSTAQQQMGSSDYNNGIVYALYTYEAQNEDELSFKCFDELIVVDKHENVENGDANDGWWTCKLKSNPNVEGLVPRNYLGLFPRVRPGQHKESFQEESTIC